MKPAESSMRPACKRGLSTARSALRVLALLVERPEGLRAADVAGAVGKSLSTAYHLLDSLCEEGFAFRDPSSGTFRLKRNPYRRDELADQVLDLAEALNELHARTRKRSYLARVQHRAIEIVGVRGRQGVPKMPGFGTRIADAAHAVALGKVVLSLLPEPARRRYAHDGLKAFTPATITSPEELLAELEEVREQGCGWAALRSRPGRLREDQSVRRRACRPDFGRAPGRLESRVQERRRRARGGIAANPLQPRI
jgi:DNA-binding IclR family transcriptional regulator